MENNKIKGFVQKVHSNGILLQTKKEAAGLWYNAVGDAAQYVKPDLIGSEVELTIMDQVKRTFTFIKVQDAARDGGQSKPGIVDRDRIIVRQNALSQASSFLKLALDLELIDSLDMKDLNDVYFNFAERCEKWVFR